MEKLASVQKFFFGGAGAKPIAVQISIVMIAFLLFSDKILKGGRAKIFDGELLQGMPACGRRWNGSIHFAS